MSESKDDNLLKLADECCNRGNFLNAVEYYKNYLLNNPKNALIYNRIGYLYGKADENKYLEEQVEYFKKALEINPDYAGAIRNLALTYPVLGENEKALECFNKLFELEELADDYFAYACLNIKLGNFDEGWKHYESRFLKKYGRTEYPVFNKPRWNGEKILDKVLLVQSEQGFGDSLMFYRYLELIKPLVKRIIFRVQKELVDLFKLNFGELEIISSSKPFDELNFDYHIPLMSLPFVMRTEMNNIPQINSYLKADTAKVEQYREKFFDNDYLKIGIAYKGMALGNKRRNIPLRYFSELGKIPNAKIYSFQKTSIAEDSKSLPANFEIIDLGTTFKDFSDTAAAMANVDLFITSDNAVLNLAGAMGKKTFLLLNENSEWRWFFDEDTTPWYDSVKIFKKQKENENWSLLMRKVVKEVL